MTFGFSTNEEETVGSDWVFTKGNWEIELHNCMLYLNDKNSKCHVDYTDQAWNRAYTDDGVQYHLKPEFHFVFLILHLRKHFLWSGVGIRLFLDLAMMIKNCPMDWAVIERDLTELQLPDFAKVCFALIHRWFDVTAPIPCAEIGEAFYVSSTETILGSGVFGDMDKDTIADNAVMNTVRKENSGCWDKMKMMLEVVFPSYYYMKTKYPRMAVSPLLLPLLWVIRIVESLFKKRAGGSLSYAAKPLTLNRELQERDELLKQWGL